MEAVAVPLPLDTWDALPVDARVLVLALQAQIVALQAEVAALHAQRRALQARLGQDSFDSSRPPSSDPPRSAARRTGQAPPPGPLFRQYSEWARSPPLRLTQAQGGRVFIRLPWETRLCAQARTPVLCRGLKPNCTQNGNPVPSVRESSEEPVLCYPN